MSLQPSPLLLRAYDPENFRAQGQLVLDRMAVYLKQAEQGAMAVLDSLGPQDLLAHFVEASRPGQTDLKHFLDDFLTRVHHLHHPRFFCAQVVPILPLAAWSEAVVALLNNSSAVFEMGPASVALENLLLDWLAEKIGYETGSAGGVLTNGGSAGNLTGLLAARQARAGYDIWEEGHRGERYTVLVSEQAHYCVQRAVQIMGWGAAGATLVGVDQDYRMTRETLAEAHERAVKQGLTPLAVSASACTTSSGAYDPMDAVANFCDQHKLWMHVDGAHGAPVLLSQRLRDRVKGLERADSIVWDLHKMMAMPLTTTAVLFRRKEDSFGAFRQKATYLFGDSEERPWFQSGMRTLECSKRNMGLSFWMALQVYGEAFFRDYVEYTHDLAQAFAEQIVNSPDFELAAPPQSNIVCFRWRPHGSTLDDLQQSLRDRVNQSGQASVGLTRLRDGLYLRAVFMNPLSRIEDAMALLDLIRDVGGRA